MSTTSSGATGGGTSSGKDGAAVQLTALAAKQGDCLVVEYASEAAGAHRILIDGGLTSSYDEGLGRYVRECGEHPVKFDIAVVTHVDLDHIQGVIHALEQGAIEADDYWFNGREQIDALINGPNRGTRQGDELSEHLPDDRRNLVAGGKTIHVPDDGPITYDLPGGAVCTLLAPSPKRLERLLDKWAPPKADRAAPNTLDDLASALDESDEDEDTTRAGDVFGKDTSRANGSSIAFLFEFEGVSLLLTGDAFAPDLLSSIELLLKKRRRKTLKVDLFKLSHHGSMRNMNDDLLGLISPEQVLVCTNGDRFDHPDAKALEKICEFYPNAPIHFTDNTPVIAERARAIGLEPPGPDQLPVRLRFGTVAGGIGQAPTSPFPAPRPDSSASAPEPQTSPPAGPAAPRRPGGTARLGSGTAEFNGVKISAENLRAEIQWGRGSATRGGTAAELDAKIDNDLKSHDGSVDFEVVAEGAIHDLVQDHSGAKRDGSGGGDSGRLVVELGTDSGSERRVVLVEENGTFGWYIPEPGADTVEIAAAAGATGHRGALASLVRRKIRVIAIKGLKHVAGGLAKAAVGEYEQRRNPPELRAWDHTNYREQRVGQPDLVRCAGSKRSLLIVHGFMGSIHGSYTFEEATVRRLHAAYDGRVMGYNHPTITPTPLDNAQDLIQRLEGRELCLDILAHSRGGLVAREFARLAQDPNSKIDIRSIVFVATPNGGTPLADPARPQGILDAVTNLAGHIPGTDGFALVLEMLADIVLEGVLPALGGMMSMNPAGEYNIALNKQPPLDHIVLRSIAAEYEPAATAGFLQAKIDDALDLYFGQLRNDRVVPTSSTHALTGDFQIQPGQRLVLDSSRGVHHSSFWTDPRATRQLLTWLSAEEDAAKTPKIPEEETDPQVDVATVATTTSMTTILEGVRSLPETIRKSIGMVTGDAAKSSPPNGERDAVIVLPGIMGSHLAVEGRGSIWVDTLRLSRGGLEELSFVDKDGAFVSRERVSPTGMNSTYVPLIARLAENWDVHLFPYDWRDDIFNSADRLHELVDKLRRNHPERGVNFVAHSMGGLVTRAYVAAHRDKWNELGDVEGAASGRLVMLGTPNRGSYSIPLTLLGSELAVRGLAAIDRKHDTTQLAKIIAGFPGVYQMLPHLTTLDDGWAALFEEATWTGRAEINPALLKLALDTHRRLDADGIDAGRFTYVAGYGKDTPFRVNVDDKELRIGKFAMGDGRVAHELGELDGMPMHFVDATHGGLVQDEFVLGTIDELITTGKAPLDANFLAEPPARRGLEDQRITWLDSDKVDRQPNVAGATTRGGSTRLSNADTTRVIDDSLSMLLGGSAQRHERPQINVQVVHASLEQTEYPVAVGHYARMPAQGADWFLSTKLDGALEKRYLLNLNADDEGKAMVVRAQRGHHPGGAVVVGLGEFGALTESIVSKGITDGVLQLARMRIEAGEDRTETLGLAAVLIGTPGRYGLSVEASMIATVEGVIRAIDQLGDDRPDVFELQFMELYQQQADHAATVLCTLAEEIHRDLIETVDLNVEHVVKEGDGRRPGAPAHDASGKPWIRVQAVLDRHDDAPDSAAPKPAPEPESPIKEITVAVLSRQAQSDRISHEVDLAKIRDYIEAAIRSHDPTDNVGQTLYELLLPHNAKIELNRSEHLLLMLDEELGELPWELLAGRDSGSDASGALALRAGFLRQLLSDSPRRTGSVRPAGLQALVVGDPPTNYDRLPGARREATEVVGLLEAGGWDVRSVISSADDQPGDTWRNIDNALHAAPYRVVHIAAHGILDEKLPMRSGVVTGAGAHHRLTTLDFRAMSVQPDLVFLNCCHLGNLGDPTADTLASWSNDPLRQPNKLASTVARQLLSNGVKAVIVAGWAVDDQAAAVFADTLYRCLLDFEPLGEAVRRARNAAFDINQGRSNTWGAYQCWGDPDFQLVPGSSSRAGDGPIVSENVLIQELQILKGDAGQAAPSDKDRLSERLQKLVERSGDLLDRPRALLALGDACQEIDEFGKAADAYRRSIDAVDGGSEIRAIEQYANMLVRHAARADGAADFDSFRIANTTLTKLISAVGQTDERYALLGSLHKKRAVVLTHQEQGSSAPETDGEEKSGFADSMRSGAKGALSDSIQDYQRAREIRGKKYAYCANVWLQLRYAASSESATAEDLEEGEELLRQAEQNYSSTTEFWGRSAIGDARLTMFLLTKDPTHIDEALQAYRNAFENRSTFRQRDSVRAHIDDLLVIFEPYRADGAPLAELRELRTGLGSD